MPAKKTTTPPSVAAPKLRVFKTVKFAALASKRGIPDQELCDAIRAVQASPKTYSIGGEVYKKRINNNLDRSIILAKGGKNWFFAHLFQKNTQDNITPEELDAFKKAAKELGKLTEGNLDDAVKAGKLKEICNDCSNTEEGKS